VSARLKLYDKTVVHHHKRHGRFSFGGRTFDFRVNLTASRDPCYKLCLLLRSIAPEVRCVSKHECTLSAEHEVALSGEFLLVDLVNNLDRLAESRNEVLARVKERAPSYDVRRLRRAARDYGNVRTKRFFSQALKAGMASHVNQNIAKTRQVCRRRTSTYRAAASITRGAL